MITFFVQWARARPLNRVFGVRGFGSCWRFLMRRVDRALWDATLRSDERRALLADMSLFELHEFVAHYNWDDGFELMFAVVERDDCDLATALLVFWLADPTPLFGDNSLSPDSEAGATRERLVRYIAERAVSGGYARTAIRFDPLGKFIPNRLQQRLLETKGLPAILLNPTHGSGDTET